MLFTQRAQDGEECCAIVLGKQEYLIDDRGPRINDHMVEAGISWRRKTILRYRDRLVKSFHCQSSAEGYAEALAFGSPAVVTLLLNMAAFATDIDAEFLSHPSPTFG
jgi:hypothetical protein